MATAKNEEGLPGTPWWLLDLAGSFLGGILFWFIGFLPAASLALIFTPRIYPSAGPFLELVVVGFLPVIATINFSESEAEELNRILQKTVNKPPRERLIYTAFILITVVSAVTFEVAVFGVVTAAIAESTAYAQFAVIAALLAPMADSWTGRLLGVNIATVGGLIGRAITSTLAVSYHVPTSLAREASNDFRASFVRPG